MLQSMLQLQISDMTAPTELYSSPFSKDYHYSDFCLVNNLA